MELDGQKYKGKVEKVKSDESILLPEIDYTRLSQRDSKWNGVKLGFSSLTIGDYGCYLTCLSMMVNKTPDKVNKLLQDGLAFEGANIISSRAAEVLGLKYFGKSLNVDTMPDWTPCIKEVKMNGYQHFVLRLIEPENKKASSFGTLIVDPWTGKYETINYYDSFVSYRLFKK